jgi:hypothetical protein
MNFKNILDVPLSRVENSKKGRLGMVVAKNPGVGQGRGGGRPRREEPVQKVQLRLSPHAAELLRAAALAEKIPPWALVERTIIAALGGAEGPVATQPLSPEALEIAGECTAFLQAQEDRRAAVRALRRAWAQALSLAHHDLQTPPPNVGME